MTNTPPPVLPSTTGHKPHIGHYPPNAPNHQHTQHNQQHPYTHGSHQYQVEEREETAPKKNHFLKSHPILVPLIGVLFVLVLIFVGLRQSGFIQQRVVVWLSDAELLTDQSTSEPLQSIPTLENQYLFSNQAQIFAVDQKTQAITDLNNTLLQSAVGTRTKIIPSPDNNYLLLVQSPTTTQVIYRAKNQSSLLSELIPEQYSNLQILDVMWHPEQPILYFITASSERNQPLNHLVQVTMTTNQIVMTQIQVGNQPMLRWINTTNQSVYITSQITEQLSQVTIVDRVRKQSNQRIPLAFFGSASKNGEILAREQGNLVLKQIFNLTATNASLPIDPSLAEQADVFWHQNGSALSLLINPQQNTRLITVTNSGFELCSLDLLAASQHFFATSTEKLISINQDQSVTETSLTDCQQQNIFGLQSQNIIQIHGELH